MDNVDFSAQNAMLVLRTAKGNRTTKRWYLDSDGEPASEDYDQYAKWWFAEEEHEIEDQADLHDKIVELSQRDDCIVVYGDLSERGAMLDIADQPIERTKRGPDACLRECERQFLVIDIDKLDVDADRPMQQLKHVWKHVLPECLREVTCTYQFTSGQGFKPGLNVRLWYWLDKPVPNEVLRQWAKLNPPCDPSVFVTTQPIYVNSPVLDGVSAPISQKRRVGLLAGLTDTVETDLMELEDARHIASRNHRQGTMLRRRDVEVSEQQIANETARMLASETTAGQRHHHMVGIAGDLWKLGDDPTHIAEVLNDYIAKYPDRELVSGEVENILHWVAERDEAGDLGSDIAPVKDVLDDLPELEEPEETPDLEGGLDDPEGLGFGEYLPKAEHDHHNAHQMHLKLFGGKGYLRWKACDWFYEDHRWRREEDPEVLPGMLARDACGTMNNGRQEAVVRLFRKLHQRAELHPPCWTNGESGPADMVVFKNGMASISGAAKDPEGALRPHNMNFFNLSCRPYDYDPEATCPTFTRCIEDWFPDSEETRREIQKLMGYLIVNDYSFEHIFLLTDTKGGRSGKGTFLQVLQWLLGSEDVGAIDPAILGTRFGLSDLVGRTVLIGDEFNVRRARDVNDLAVSRLKAISGHSQVSIEDKGVRPWPTVLPGRVVLAANEMPNLPDGSQALLKRMRIIRFERTFYDGKGIDDRDVSLKKEHGPLHAELSGIFNWALEGYRMLYNEDMAFFNTASGKTLKDDFGRASAPVNAFVEDCILTGRKDERVSRDVLYGCYQAWSADQGYERCLAKNQFFKDFRGAVGDFGETRVKHGNSRVRMITGLQFNREGHILSGQA